MNKDLEILTKQVIKHYGIDVPVMATRVVGKTLELYLYGGRVLRVPIEGDSQEEERDPSPSCLGTRLRSGNEKSKSNTKGGSILAKVSNLRKDRTRKVKHD